MSGDKMQITKEALQLFIKSLPSTDDTFFQIISFGTNFHFLDMSEKPLAYNQENIDFAMNKIENFSANMAGTYIRKPLQKALDLELPVPRGQKKT